MSKYGACSRSGYASDFALASKSHTSRLVKPRSCWWTRLSSSYGSAIASAAAVHAASSSAVTSSRAAYRGRGDVGVDVQRSGACRPVTRALLAADRPPRERRALHVQRLRSFAREVQGGLPPAERVRGGMRRGGDEHGQHEALGVPERMPVVARTGEALGRDRALLGAARCLQSVE